MVGADADGRRGMSEIHTLGVAISGGGIRAALFAMGGLIYLVDAGLNRNIRLISSVSGGSILNTLIAMMCDLSTVDVDVFRSLMARTAHRLSQRGVFFWPGAKKAALFALGTVVFAAVYMEIAVRVFDADKLLRETKYLILLIIATTTYILILLVATFICGRRARQVAMYELFLKKLWVESGATARPRRLEDLPQSAVSHVLCATELTSGKPFYMSRDMLFSPIYGRTSPDMTLPQAMYASAAFPIGFPPLKVDSRKLAFNDGLEDEVPKWIFLSDGGVFNNLATETFSASEAERLIYLPDPSTPVIPCVDQHIVINASAPPQVNPLRVNPLTNWPGMRFLLTSARIMSVLYESTLRPRVQKLMELQSASPQGPIVVDISESPIELTERIQRGRHPDDPIRLRAESARRSLLADRNASEWKKVSTRAASTKTVLSPVGPLVATRLIRLGYIEMAISCYSMLNTLGIDSVPSEAWFRRLVRGAQSQPLERPPESQSLS